MDKKYEIKHYPGDRVWVLAEDINYPTRHYVQDKVVLSVELWPVEGLVYNLVYEELPDVLAELEEDRYLGTFYTENNIYSTEESAKQALKELEDK